MNFQGTEEFTPEPNLFNNKTESTPNTNPLSKLERRRLIEELHEKKRLDDEINPFIYHEKNKSL